MLSYDSLIEQAKSKGIPSNKIRGILREYLQILILKELYKTVSGNKFYFTGGTYLRLVHNLKRFSEDLDFNATKMTGKEFEDVVKKIKNELKRIGVDSQLRFAHWDNVYVSKLIFPEIEKIYNVISRYSKKEGIVIKLEVNNLKQEIKSQSHVISGFGEFFPCICTDVSILFADKIDALGKKKRGRHIYDVIFMLSNKHPVDESFLKGLGIKKNPTEAILEEIAKFSEAGLKKQAEILRPFLFEENQADLVANAHNIIPELIEKYKKP